VEGDDRATERHRRIAEPERNDVDGKEAAAVDARRDAVGERSGRDRGDGREGREVGWQERHEARCEDAERDADHEAEAELASEQRREVAAAVAARLDPRDQAERQCNRCWVVHARLGGEHGGQPAPETREAQRRKDRGGVRRPDDSAEQERLRPGEVEEGACGDAGHEHRHDDPDRAEQERGAEHGAHVAPLRRQAALEEDRDQADDPDRACELRVVEVDPARTLRAEQHPEPEERDQEREAKAARRDRGSDGDEQDAARDQDLLVDPRHSASQSS
jgi:hypothetical protein